TTVSVPVPTSGAALIAVTLPSGLTVRSAEPGPPPMLRWAMPIPRPTNGRFGVPQPTASAAARSSAPGTSDWLPSGSRGAFLRRQYAGCRGVPAVSSSEYDVTNLIG